LRSLTKLDVPLPKEISGYLDLRSLTKLDVPLPEKCGSLYLSKELKAKLKKGGQNGK
jgi:hypothetical protein